MTSVSDPPTTNLCAAGATAGIPTTLNGSTSGPFYWSCSDSTDTQISLCQTLAPAFYVATNGSDSNPGTLDQPFATFGKCQTAMQGNTTAKTCYIRAGTYNSPAALNLGSSDAGETWSFFPPDGYGTAILDGGSTVGSSARTGGNGMEYAIMISGVSNVTITGLQFQRYQNSAIFASYAPSFTASYNIIHDITGAAWGWSTLILINSPGSLVNNNYLYNVAYNGIAVGTENSVSGGISNTTIYGNMVINSCTYPAVPNGNDQDGGDCGAIYIQDTSTPSSTDIQVADNFVRDVNVESDGHGDYGIGNAVGIYMDDGASNVTSTGNVVGGIHSSCFLIHGGDNDVMEGNICDLADSGPQEIIWYQGDFLNYPMSGNVFENNIVISGGGGGGYDSAGGTGTPITINSNDYYSYGGGSISTSSSSGVGNDTDAVNVNPQISGWDYEVSTSSPVVNAPVYFRGIYGAWGPPGLAVPETGTPPSSPH